MTVRVPTELVSQCSFALVHQHKNRQHNTNLIENIAYPVSAWSSLVKIQQLWANWSYEALNLMKIHRYFEITVHFVHQVIALYLCVLFTFSWDMEVSSKITQLKRTLNCIYSFLSFDSLYQMLSILLPCIFCKPLYFCYLQLAVNTTLKISI